MAKCPFISASGTEKTVDTIVDLSGTVYTLQGDGSYQDGSGNTPSANGATEVIASSISIAANDCPQSTLCQQWDTNRNECGLNSKGQSASLPLASVLMTEFFNNEDRDGISVGALQGINPAITGSVYGYDFQIDETDGDFPSVLYGVHQHGNFNSNAPTITWAQYKSL